MNFDEYKDEINSAVGKWLDALGTKSRAVAEELKEDAGDIIASAKDNFPRRKDEIQKFVDEKMETFFKERE